MPRKSRSPATCAATNGDALDTRCRKAKTQSRHPAAAYFFASHLCFHDTAAVLSLKRPTCLYQRFLVPTIPSNTSHKRSFTAISRSFISKSPHGFVGVISLARNLFGHSKRNFFGSSASFPGSQSPPTPSPYASTQPISSGSPMNNSFDVVGSREASFSSVIQSRNACFASGKSFHQTISGFTCRILLIGVIKFFPVGTAVAACQIFPINFSIRLNGTPFAMRTILCSSALITLYLYRVSLMQHVAPSTIQPRTSFLTTHWPLSDSNFFLDIGSCPLCPAIYGGGNTLWIPCSNSLYKWINCAVSLVCAMCIKSPQNTSSMVQNGFPSNGVNNLLN